MATETNMRELWRAIEAVHDVVYFAPEAATVYADVGCRGWWMGYFASRAAALGPVGPAVVEALFFGFAPALVRRAIPDAWSFADIDAVLAARRELARLALQRVLETSSPSGTGLTRAELAEAAALTQQMVAIAPRGGRALFAAHAALPRPDDPIEALWHDVTALREFRGDGHVSALVQAGLSGCSANVLMVALGHVPPQQRERRGFSESEWAAATDELVERGWLDAAGSSTPDGAAAREEIERATDRACEPALRALDPAARDRLSTTLLDLARHIAAAEAVPYPNPTGVPAARRGTAATAGRSPLV